MRSAGLGLRCLCNEGFPTLTMVRGVERMEKTKAPFSKNIPRRNGYINKCTVSHSMTGRERANPTESSTEMGSIRLPEVGWGSVPRFLE